MRENRVEKTRSILCAGVSGFMLLMFSIIISAQNISIQQIVHSSSKSVCSCGCESDGGSCGGCCCATESFSQCGCTEPHKTVVVFIVPGQLDTFLQLDQLALNLQVSVEAKYTSEESFYESFYRETPAPIPIYTT